VRFPVFPENFMVSRRFAVKNGRVFVPDGKFSGQPALAVIKRTNTVSDIISSNII
jgi:hypothetical protein